MQGRIDVIELLLGSDTDKKMTNFLNKETSLSSLAYLAIMNDFQNCASWLIRNGFPLREGEADALLYKILTEEIAM